jgi:peptide/nickel transport system substrate-binding protein
LNDFLSGVAARGVYEPLIALKGGSTDEYEGRIAEAWDANADQSVWTFHLREGVTFQDGSPCDAEAVRASCERPLSLGRGLSYVLARFVSDPGQITAPDAGTVVLTLAAPSRSSRRRWLPAPMSSTSSWP